MAKKKPRKTREDKKRHQQAFLAAFSAIGIMTKAAKAAKVSPCQPYEWLKEDGLHGDEFRRLYAEAEKHAGEALEAEARRRAVDGLKRFKFHNGTPIIDPETEQPYFEYEYSDTLLIFLMKGVMPDKYRERQSVDLNSKVEVKDVTVTIDENWYGNANRLSAFSAASPASGVAVASQAEACLVRPAVGENGHGSNGNGHGSRPTPGGNGRSH